MISKERLNYLLAVAKSTLYSVDRTLPAKLQECLEHCSSILVTDLEAPLISLADGRNSESSLAGLMCLAALQNCTTTTAVGACLTRHREQRSDDGRVFATLGLLFAYDPTVSSADVTEDELSVMANWLHDQRDLTGPSNQAA